MITCPSCGQENPEGFRLCGMCGASLAPEAVPAREERKVVTILFTDLVGSTARAEGLDPEDVRATLSAYYAQLRAELERYGGTVEKFIGDAVMAVFGAPVAHEDDAERAVRAAHLVALVGVRGIGKSRLVAELFQITEADPDLISWRQGRSLPYGEHVSFWALGEIVKAHAGILESDDTAEAEEKLAAMVV